ncbi:MAG: hypothetical protein AABX51_02265 [Nanoarchaeota archaeon]
MAQLNFIQQIVLGIVGLIWLGIIVWFIFSVSRWSVLLFLIAGIFVTLAFVLSSYILLKSHQPFGLTAAYAIVAVCITVLVFNSEFTENMLVQTICYSIIMSLLFFVAVTKIWDTLDYWQQ